MKNIATIPTLIALFFSVSYRNPPVAIPKRSENRGWLGVSLKALTQEQQIEFEIDFPGVQVQSVSQ